MYLSERAKLSLYLLLIITLTSIDYVLYVRWVNTMKNYTWIAGSLFFPVFGFIFFLIPTLYLMYYKKSIKKEETQISQKVLLGIGIFDNLNALIATLAIPHLSVAIMTILDKLTLPFTMLLSYFLLKRRYYESHYLGVFLTLYAVSLSFIPEFLSNNIQGVHYIWLVLYIISILPAVFSYGMKEKYLKNNEPNIWWMNTFIALYQIIFGMITIPMILIPKISDIYLTTHNFESYIENSIKCQFLGINSLKGDNCQYSLLWFISYQFIGTICNILMFLIIKEGSSVLFIIINTLKSPITAYLGSYPILAGKSASPVTVADWYALILLIVAGGVYYHKDEIEEKKSLLDLDGDLLRDDYYNDARSESITI